MLPILSITGSDGTGGSGIQADIKTCGVLGGYALTVVTAVTVQDTRGIQSTLPMPTDVVEAQLQSIITDVPPRAAKVGMVCNAESASVVGRLVRQVPHVVLDCAFVSSRGEQIASQETIDAVCRRLMPWCDIVIMKLREAEHLTGRSIVNRDTMVAATRRVMDQYGISCIIVRGTHHNDDTSHDLLITDDHEEFLSLPDETGRNTHGLSGTLSASIATYLGQGHALHEAVRLSYEYLRTLTVYSVGSGLLSHTIAPGNRNIYNRFMELIANHCCQQHEVSFYARALHITPRYLAQITAAMGHKTPRDLIIEGVIDETVRLLVSTQRSIQEIAYDTGFSSQAQLSRTFRRIKGTTPSEWRRKGSLTPNP